MEIVMTQENKELLLKDLSARLPYETMFYTEKYGEECLLSIDLEYEKVNELYGIQDIKPYLRPMLIMTEEEGRIYCAHRRQIVNSSGDLLTESITAYNDFLNSHHFDYRGLIPMGLALEAPEGMYKN